MNTWMKHSLAIAILPSLFLSGCQNLTPEQNALLVGGTAGVAGATISSALGAPAWESLAIGAGAAAVTGIATEIIAQHVASEQQRAIAEARARQYYARMAESKKIALKKKNVRYLAVDTVNSKETSPQAKKSVMIWDTKSEQVVGSKVYDVKTPPEAGQTGQFNTYTADYIAMGD